MTQFLRSDGDPVERAYIDFVESHFPSYARLWSDFVGNDGTSSLPLQERLDSDIASLRQSTAQCLYSALIAVICAKREADKDSQARNVEEYLDAVTRLVAFYAHLGRLRDCLKRVGDAWDLPALAEPLESVYQQRNSVLHDALSPVSVLCGALTVVPPGVDQDPKRWGRRSSWAEASKLDFQPLDLHLRNTLDEVIIQLESTFARLHSRVCQRESAVVEAMRALASLPNSPKNVSASGPGLVFGQWADDLLSK